MSEVKNPNAKWFVDLCNRFTAIVHNLGIPDTAADELKSFIIDIAKEQYLAGNKSGIRWARQQASAGAF